MDTPFNLFGPAHVGAMITTFVVAIALSLALHRRRSPTLEHGIRVGLAAFLVVATTAHVFWVLDHREVTVWEFLPLHLCDLCIFVALYALATKQRLAAETLYFWTCSGTLLAMMLPACETGFPTSRFFIYFSLHGGIIVVAVFLVYALGLRPDRRSPLRAFAITRTYTAIIEAVRTVILENLDKDYEEGMMWGMIGYAVPHRVWPLGYHCDPEKPLMMAALSASSSARRCGWSSPGSAIFRSSFKSCSSCTKP